MYTGKPLLPPIPPPHSMIIPNNELGEKTRRLDDAELEHDDTPPPYTLLPAASTSVIPNAPVPSGSVSPLPPTSADDDEDEDDKAGVIRGPTPPPLAPGVGHAQWLRPMDSSLTLASSSSSTAPAPATARPTTTPQAGHPLLHKGQVLFYPAGVRCKKCYNTGYQRFDPARPCAKCWRQYGHTYAGPLLAAFDLASASALANPSDAASAESSVQRPLPENFALVVTDTTDGADPALEPTARPQHGHPLMYKKKVLFYPADHTCPKCCNTGYKGFRPSKPCSGCWKTYGRVLNGDVLGPAPSPAAWAESQGLVLQRPLTSNNLSRADSLGVIDAPADAEDQSDYHPSQPPSPHRSLSAPDPRAAYAASAEFSRSTSSFAGSAKMGGWNKGQGSQHDEFALRGVVILQ